MSSNLQTEKIWRALKEKTFFAKVSVNCKKIGVTIEYFPPLEMRVSGLEPEYPPYVRFKNGLIKISLDKEKWERIEPDSGIQILRLLDPRVLLTPARPSILKVAEYFRTDEEFGFVGVYDIEYLNKVEKLKLQLPKEIISWIVEKGQKSRLVTLLLRRDYLIDKMTQNDLPPSTEVVTLTFQYEKRNTYRIS